MNHQNFKINFITRQANNVAYLLAKASLCYASSQVHDYMSPFYLDKKSFIFIIYTNNLRLVLQL